MDLNHAFDAFKTGAMAAWKYIDIDEILTKQLPPKEEVSFDGLTRLIQRSIDRKEGLKLKKKTNSITIGLSRIAIPLRFIATA